MDVKEFTSKVKEKFLLTYDRVKDSVFSNTKTVILCCLSLILILLILILILLMTAPKKPKTYSQDLILTEDLLVMPSPSLPEGSSVSRTTKDSWTDEELDVWFTEPSKKELDDLSKSNNRIVSEITGAAP